jgi:hypothetical protein
MDSGSSEVLSVVNFKKYDAGCIEIDMQKWSEILFFT